MIERGKHAQIIFNGISTYDDLGLTIESKNIGFPDKKKVIQQIPYSNNVIDLSNLYGAPVYTERTLTYTFNIADRFLNSEAVSSIKTIIVNRFMQIGDKKPLYDLEELREYYYMAELQEAPNFDEIMGYGKLTLKFRAYPFKRSTHHEGEQLWDPFNFDLDVFQDTAFTINVSREITLVNSGVSFAVPTVRISGLSSPIKITVNGYTYEYASNGDYKSDDLYLAPGTNTLLVKGNGTVEFLWYKELI